MGPTTSTIVATLVVVLWEASGGVFSPWFCGSLSLYVRSLTSLLTVTMSSPSSWSLIIDVLWYEPYQRFMPSKQACLLDYGMRLASSMTRQSRHIKPSSVKSYLSGICNQLETFYPSVRNTRHSNIVTCTLTGCTKLRASPTLCKRAISHDEIITIFSRPSPTTDHDTSLFLAIACVSFFGLVRIGENVWPDNPALRDYRKVIKRSTVSITMDCFSFLLNSHKADRLFQGNKILIHSSTAGPTAISAFSSYILSRSLILL